MRATAIATNYAWTAGQQTALMLTHSQKGFCSELRSEAESRDGDSDADGNGDSNRVGDAAKEPLKWLATVTRTNGDFCCWCKTQLRVCHVCHHAERKENEA